MRTRSLLFIFIILFPLSFFAQTKVSKTSVYFDNDKYVLRKDAKKALDNLFDTLQNVSLLKITLKGNTDNSADSLYNIKLSQNRTETVKNYLLTKGIDPKIIATDYFGENKPIAPNESDDGKQKNRRVDITVAYKLIPLKADSIPPPSPKIIPKKDTCNKDTTLILPQGTQVTFNRCEYLELKDCLEITEANSADSILSNGMALMDSSGIPISSCGMLRISLNGSCGDGCFKTPVKVRFPVPQKTDCDYCGSNARVFLVNKNGSWTQMDKNKSSVKIVKINGQFFYQFEVKCPNAWTNCDCKVKGTKIKFKTKPGYKIESVTVSYECPRIVVRADVKRRKNCAVMYLPCPKSSATVTAVVINRKGDTLTLTQKPLNDLPKKVLFSKCGKNKNVVAKKALGFIPLKAHGLYRKYIIKPKLLTKKE
jgi:hypothetical protein